MRAYATRLAVCTALAWTGWVICVAAQSQVTLTPSAVTAAGQRIVIRAAKSDGSADTELAGKIATVSVDGKTIKTEAAGADSITFAAPAVEGSGKKTVVLLDAANRELKRSELDYQLANPTAPPPAGAAAQDDEAKRKEQARRDNLSESSWYYMLVSLMFAAVLVPFVIAIYRGTSGSKARDDRPLGLPVGSFRSILAYSLVAYLGFYVLTSILSVSPFAPPDFLLGIVATVIGFYFGSRSNEDGGGAPTAAIVRGAVQDDANPARGALVKFTRASDGVAAYTRITDTQGRFELTGAAPGKYSIVASAGSAASDPQDLTLTAGSDHELKLALKRAAGH